MLGAQCLHEHVLLPWGKYLKICAQTALIAGLQWETCTYLDVEICNILGQSVWFGATNSWINVQELPKSGETCTWQNQKLDETKKEKLPNKNQPSNCNVQKVLFRMWPRGHKKLGSLPDCGRRLAFWERSFFAAQNCYCRHAKNGSMSWVLGHGPIRPNTFWIRCFRYVLGVQIHSQSQEVFGCLGCYPKWFYPSFFW